jgi:hypothetical protein
MFFDNPAQHRFQLALYALKDCMQYALEELSEEEEKAKDKLLYLLKKIADEGRSR